MPLRAIVFAAVDGVGEVDTYLLCGLSLALAFTPWLKDTAEPIEEGDMGSRCVHLYIVVCRLHL